MKVAINRSQIAVAVATVLSAATMAAATAKDVGNVSAKGTYATGDFHNHTTCSDGSISMQKLVKKSTDTQDTPWGLDWFIQAGHGGNGNRNCTLVEDASLSTPAYPFVEGRSPSTTWAASIGAAAVKGNTGSNDGSSTTPLGSQANPSMWRWQSVLEYQYPVTEYLSSVKNVPVFIGLESVVAGHEHTSMSIITGQVVSADLKGQVTSNGYSPAGNATALSQWSYCFDRGDTDNSRAGAAVWGQKWDCKVPDSLNEADPSWSPVAGKLMPAGGAGSGVRGHQKTVEAIKWMDRYHTMTSYYVPAHLERAGPFNPDGNNGFNIEHLRNFNNAGASIAFGMETQPGHHASSDRGEYRPDRNNIGGVLIDSVGGTTYGGTGVYGAQIGGVWDALLGEGRAFWFFASSDWHNRGSFGPDDRRSTQDFYPGEYQRDYVLTRKNGKAKQSTTELLQPQEIVDGLRSGNSWTATGQLIDRLTFVACPGKKVTNEALEAAALAAAKDNTQVDLAGCATMGGKVQIKAGSEVVVAIVARDPEGKNYAPYTFANPSLAQVGITQPLNKPVLDHIDVIRGQVKGLRKPADPDYAGQWPNDWLENPDMNNVPAAAKNTTAAVLRTYGEATWKSDGEYKVMSFRIPAITKSQYVRLRGTNLPPAVPYETDANGNPLADLYTNAGDPSKLTIPCTVNPTVTIPAGATYSGDAIDGCPDHLQRFPAVTGPKFVSYDVAAWADLWFYSNPIYVEVKEDVYIVGVQ